MQKLSLIALCAVIIILTGCRSQSPDGNYTALPPLPAPDGQGHPGPVNGTSRAGTSYDVNIKAADGNNIAFTVHEPVTLTGGQKYPLLLNGPGFGMTRTNALERNLQAPSGTPLVDITTTKQFTDQGYGVISFDQRGFGQSGGQVTVMNPDTDGPNLVAIVDWAESNLDWLQYRGNKLVLGSYGGSYGGMYQMLLNNIDPRQRLMAIAPAIAPHELGYSLGSGGTPKSGWGIALTAAGEASSSAVGNGGMDPAVLAVLQDGLTSNGFTPADYQLLHYHSNAYFCDGITQAGKRNATPPRKVDALFMQGMSDALFNLNEGKLNYECLSKQGGDVRLYSYTIGHVLPAGTTGLLPPPPTGSNGGTAAPGISDTYRCGPYVADAITLLWMNAKLKLDPTAINTLNNMPRVCLNIGANGEGVVVNSVPVGSNTSSPIPATTVIEASPTQSTVLLYTATQPTVVAGLPTATLTISNATPISLPIGIPSLPLPIGGTDPNDALVYASIGVTRGGAPAITAGIINDQIRPIRGLGTQTVELNGIGIKLAAGDQLYLMLSGVAATQYPGIVSRNITAPIVTVSGSVQLPILGNVATLQ